MSSNDVVVVGGGPAGSVTALLLARAGFAVELVERHSFPRAKPCGDCVSPGANAILRRLGVWDEIMRAAPARLAGWEISTAAGPRFASHFPAREPDEIVSLALPRERFDAILLEAARAAGVHVSTGWQVTGLLRDNDAVTGVHAQAGDTHRAIRARMVIGADGLRSRVTRALHAYVRAPRIRKLSLTAHLRGVRCRDDFGEMHLHGKACLGLARVESVADPLYNVTVVLPAGRKREGGAHDTMRAALQEFGRPDIADLLGDETAILASGPFDWPVRDVAFDGALLVGDAAGYFDPFTGQGMYQALAGAELAARHVGRALHLRDTSRSALREYQRDHHHLYGGTRRLQRTIDFVCARPLLRTAAFETLARSPALARRLIAITGDLA